MIISQKGPGFIHKGLDVREGLIIDAGTGGKSGSGGGVDHRFWSRGGSGGRGLDQVAVQGVVLIQLSIIDVIPFKVGQQGLVIFFGGQLYAYEGRTCFFIMFLHVFEAGDIIAGSEDMVDKFF